MNKNPLLPDYLFEVSWEVCNKVGGIHTVIATKALTLVNEFDNNYILIGPDLIKEDSPDTNHEFIEDPQLFSSWKKYAETQGLYFKIGRWNINGNPIAISLNFSNYFKNKDKIFSELWESYKLDSLSGQWDYIEPALFGYAAGKVIESFVLYNLGTFDRFVAQFHEWMTGTGLLYLKKNLPQAGTVFTTHATVAGRCLAGNNRPLYKNLSSYTGDDVSKEFNITSKQSAEILTARHADAFTTVSEITARECEQFLNKQADVITPNGFENSFIPTRENFQAKRKQAREKLLQIAELFFRSKYDDDTFLIAISGRYEFRNKGIDLFIDSLGQLNDLKEKGCKSPVIAFILIPANHYGPRKDLMEGNFAEDSAFGSKYLTHNLHDAEWDPVLTRIKNAGLNNDASDSVKVIFVPSYLNGRDGIFNLSYYDLLIGLDQTVFPSYYEPWGYTPLESVAFSVPTVTTTLAGFGLWVKKNFPDTENAITVIDRNDDNDGEVVNRIVEAVINLCALSADERTKVRDKAFQVSGSALWNSFIAYYKQAYSLALQKVSTRTDSFVRIEEKPIELVHEYVPPVGSKPIWKRIVVKSKLPDELAKLGELTQNLWWTWDDEAQELLEIIEPDIWFKAHQNPVILFEQIKQKSLLKLTTDKDYLEKLDRVYDRYLHYMSEKTENNPVIAYFSMEYGIHNSIRIYSGGLGVLAGDYLKEASDRKVHLVGIGLLYRYGYFSQIITTKGEQQPVYDIQYYSKLPVKPLKDEAGNFRTITIVFPGRNLYARIWKLNVGRIELYLLDTDFDENSEEDRVITHTLYGGNNENRLKQELLLGIGGIRALDMLGIKPDLFHSNEGHSAFIGLENMRRYIQNNNLTFPEAREIVRSSTLFTTHTPVPAGHDEFEEDLLRKYIGHYPERLKTTWNELIGLGRSNKNAWNEKFNMSFLAAHLSQEMNGVSMLHGEVTRQLFSQLWPSYIPEELNIGYVTNGVHYYTWAGKKWKKLYKDTFGEGFEDNLCEPSYWEKIYDVPDKTIWDLKKYYRTNLITTIQDRIMDNWIKRHEDPRTIVAINNNLSPNALTICFARRFATYKRAYLLFRNPDRLKAILNMPNRPVQIIFAGKAHPNDKGGQDLIKMIVETSHKPEFLGKIIFVQDYDMNLAKIMIQGADIWLNTPTRPLEASGTSGQKAVLNGTLHFSVLDGWWIEGYQPGAGWALSNEVAYEEGTLQDDLDAEIIYTMLEQEIIPAFYDRKDGEIPKDWVRMMKNSIAQIAPNFITTRMLRDYNQRFYAKLYERSGMMHQDDFAMAKRISSWKKRIGYAWNNINVIDYSVFEAKSDICKMGQIYTASVILDLNEISPHDVGVELIVTENGERIVSKHELALEKTEVDKAFYKAEICVNQAGTFSYGLRIYPKNAFIAHRQDIDLARWI